MSSKHFKNVHISNELTTGSDAYVGGAVHADSLYLRDSKLVVDDGKFRIMHRDASAVPGWLQARGYAGPTTQTVEQWIRHAQEIDPTVTLTDLFAESYQDADFDDHTLDDVPDGVAFKKITAAEKTDLLQTKTRLDLLIDSGTTLDTISEIKTAWEAADNVIAASAVSLDTNQTVSGTKTFTSAIVGQVSDISNHSLDSVSDGTSFKKISAIEKTKLSQLDNETYIYCDSTRSDAYTADGSRAKPYKTLKAALEGALIESNTGNNIFCLAPGYYDGTVSITRSSQNTNVKIVGAGMDSTIVRGSSSWSSSTGNILFLRKFNDIEVRDLTFEFGAYGFYPRECRTIVLDHVRFRHCGSSANSDNFDFTKTKTEHGAIWSGSETSDGGAARIRECEGVFISNCELFENARGLRIQQCTHGQVTGCHVQRNIESGIYLASSNYAQDQGCTDFLISSNIVKNAGNNGILVIGGSRNAVKNNAVWGCANAGIQTWETLECEIAGNTIQNCNRLSYNFIGNDGDAWGNLVVDHSSSKTIPSTGTFHANICNNSILNCNQGRAAAVYGINVRSESYPAVNNKALVSNNINDATVKVFAENSFPLEQPEEFTTALKTKIDSHTTVLGDRSAAQLSYLDTSSSIQAQITAKADLSGAAFTGDVELAVGNLKVSGGSSNQVLQTNGSSVLSWVTPSSGGGVSSSDTVTWTGVHTFNSDVKNQEGAVVRQFRPTQIQQCSNTYHTDSHLKNYVITPGGEANQHFTLPLLSTLPHGFEIKAYACSGANLIFHTQGSDKVMKKNNTLATVVQGGSGKNHFIWVDDNGSGTKRYVSSR